MGAFFLGLVWNGGILGVLALLIVIPVLFAMWQIKYSSLKTSDPDYKKANRERLIALALWLPAGLLQLLILAFGAI